MKIKMYASKSIGKEQQDIHQQMLFYKSNKRDEKKIKIKLNEILFVPQDDELTKKNKSPLTEPEKLKIVNIFG